MQLEPVHINYLLADFYIRLGAVQQIMLILVGRLHSTQRGGRPNIDPAGGQPGSDVQV